MKNALYAGIAALALLAVPALTPAQAMTETLASVRGAQSILASANGVGALNVASAEGSRSLRTASANGVGALKVASAEGVRSLQMASANGVGALQVASAEGVTSLQMNA